MSITRIQFVEIILRCSHFLNDAIEVAWSRGRLDAVNRIYGYKVFSPEDKPTNGEFISCISEKLRG